LADAANICTKFIYGPLKDKLGLEVEPELAPALVDASCEYEVAGGSDTYKAGGVFNMALS
jgi:hypothetical protein